ncbi:hypothetical protein [Desulfolithobacter sp.]
MGKRIGVSMEKLIAELKEVVEFKDTTEPGDLVLVVAKEPQMLVYALVTNIERDTSRRDEWWHVSMQVLTVPPQKMTWTLRTPQMTGQEIFTMGGEERFVKAVRFDMDQPGPSKEPRPGPGKKQAKTRLRVVK